jgi:2-polyprenyl-3-methyl-5-hydroxy-6-metoxy-1,4-benzoquinol methylase
MEVELGDVRLVNISKCPACLTPVEKSAQFCSVPIGIKNNVEVRRCIACQSIYKLQIPDPEELKNQYLSITYYSFYLQPKMSAGMQSRLQRVSRVCRPRKILDVGCGNGDMVRAYLNAGWEAYGVDPYLRDLPFCHNILAGLLYKRDLAIESLPVTNFDTVTLWYVLEHVVDPHALIMGIARHMISGGRIFMLVPWSQSLACRIYRGRWSEIMLAEHLVTYSQPGLIQLLSNTGFSSPKFRYAGRPFPLGKVDHSVQSQGLHNVIGNPTLEQYIDDSRPNILEAMITKLAETKGFSEYIRIIINVFRVGDYIEVYAIKQ